MVIMIPSSVWHLAIAVVFSPSFLRLAQTECKITKEEKNSMKTKDRQLLLSQPGLTLRHAKFFALVLPPRNFVGLTFCFGIFLPGALDREHPISSSLLVIAHSNSASWCPAVSSRSLHQPDPAESKSTNTFACRCFQTSFAVLLK